jgi:DNA-binding transcriptional LysR family regulator
MDTKDWQALKVLHETGNITKASELLFISQPALSKRIRNLEEEFGVKLLLRSARGVEFTSEGEHVAAYAVEMLNRLQEAKDTVQNMGVLRTKGMIRIGAPNRFAHRVLPGLIRVFSARNPEIRVHIRSAYTFEILKWLRNEELHVAFVRGMVKQPNLERFLINRENVCLISRSPISLEVLPRTPRVVYSTDPPLHDSLEVWWQKVFACPMKTGVEVTDSQTCIQMVRQGLGYAIVPQYCLDGGNSGLFVEALRDHEGKPMLRETYMVYDRKYLDLTAVRKFVSFIRAECPPPKGL